MSGRILVVDDDSRHRRNLCRCLEQAGYHAEVAASGEEAANLVEADPPDLVILDWNLPGISGLNLLQTWRTHRRGIPVIMASGRSAVADRVACLEAGADDYVVKPYAAEELVARVAAILRRTRRNHTAVRQGSGRLPRTPFARKKARRGISGEFNDTELLEICQLIELNAKCGQLYIRSGAVAGRIHFDGGKVVGANVARATGEFAARRLLRIPRGEFEFLNEPVTHEPGLSLSPTSILMDICRSRDELERITGPEEATGWMGAD